jgi:glycosyltransferase A (GT-A) superfamily protein (DUF2064 family)
MGTVLIFAKAPIEGFVKTRLREDANLSEEETLKLYRAFFKDVLASALKTDAEKFILSYYPAKANSSVIELVGELLGESIENIVLTPQRGDDFDQRFTNAVKDSLVDSECVVVIGSDLPNIQPYTIRKALDFLDGTDGMVLGPSREGGAYLVGVKRLLDFKGVFSSGVELENLATLASKNEMPLMLLGELSDIDISSDLLSFIASIKSMEYSEKTGHYTLPKQTIAVLKEIGLKVSAGTGGQRGKKLERS